MKTWIVRGLLAALLLFASEIVLWTNPTGRALLDWPLLGIGYLVLAALLLDFAARYRLRDVFSLLALAGIYGMLASLALNPQTALADVPRTWATRVLGASVLAGWAALQLFLTLTSGRRRGLIWAAVVGGLLWGLWVRGLPTFTDILATPVTLPELLLAGGLVLAGSLLLAEGSAGRAAQLADFLLPPGAWALVGGGLIALIARSWSHLDPVSLLVLLALAGYCWLVLWFQKQDQGTTLLDASLPPHPPTRQGVLAALLFLGAGALSFSLPEAAVEGPFAVLTGLFAAFGLVWLPTISLVLGVRSYRRLGRQRRL